ncbi:hypothetical protein [Pseudomonas sp. Pseu.R1]|uniref:hypothetical protein n=1 Tax=Pseudomonas sp. Pseu.R1 TaxID=3379818 RepID=UPI003B961829
MKAGFQGLAVIGYLAVLAGCAAQPQYKMMKSGVSAQETAQDEAQCQMQAEYVQAADWEYRGTIMEGVNIKQKQQKTYGLCMNSKGYAAIRVQ